MPIKFISLNENFNKILKIHGYETMTMRIEKYKPIRKTFYVSPANSLCFMDGGIDYALSRLIFPGIEKKVKIIVKQLGIRSMIGKYYLPIGSSLIVDYDNQKSLVVAPTMLLPQDVSDTKNAYYATMAILYNILINQNQNINEIDIIFTSLCCGYGKMSYQTSIDQILKGIEDFKKYNPQIINDNIIIHEPNLLNQPKIYQNTEWFTINPSEIKNI